jgi:acyl-CoA synthetase (NDP forming)
MNNLSLLWNAQSIAIIGATERENAIGRAPIDTYRGMATKERSIPLIPKAQRF